MKYLSKIIFLLLACLAMANCGRRTGSPDADSSRANKQHSMYYWRTTFHIDSTETAFLERHRIKRLYVRMFDVATEPDFLSGTTEIVPIATTRFASAVPAGVEVVPVAYITLEALRAMEEKEDEFAPMIVERLLAMASYNQCGTVREIQLDCDWTRSTRKSFHQLCQRVKEELAADNILLSITLRLHQMQETPPPADRAVLMLYNTGALKNPQTKNSILHFADVKPYLRKSSCQLPLDYAYPVFGWGVKFNDQQFVSIVASGDSVTASGEHIRYERPSVAEVLEVKEAVEQRFGKPASGNILYHLDANQLKNYNAHEIDEILAY